MGDWDYVIVGSGAGGGTLAARLAEAGRRVVLLEAGGDAPTSGAARMPADYEVPAFHPFASENPAMSWDFFVRHYPDAATGERDPNYVAARGGVLYPRAATLGGCTAHNAMILIRPHDVDWDGIAALTGDNSWSAARMQLYFARLENCRYRTLWRWLARLGIDPTGHGWGGWLRTERAMPPAVMGDRQLLEATLRLALAAGASSHHAARLLGAGPFAARLPRLAADIVVRLSRLSLPRWLWSHVDDPLDPNDRGLRQGVCYTPLSTRDHARAGPRERLLAVARRYPDRLRIELHALATRVILDTDGRAVGVEYRKGENLYRAGKRVATQEGAVAKVHAREVILCGGAFNTPQLLMLSGIGRPEALQRHGIACRVALEGVGRNLQDRYEVGVVYRMVERWQSLDGAAFAPDDPLFRQWQRDRSGMYGSGGAILGLIHRSAAARDAPDLFCMALLAKFAGYVPGYSATVAQHHDYLSWTVLKARTGNRAGEVTLRSADPRDPPVIDFNSFAQDGETDVAAVVEGIKLVRRLTEELRVAGLVLAEELPGPQARTDAELASYARDRAWGHHACGTCAIGAPAEGGVLDSKFRVHGVPGLRVVDASIFPRIPGFFIVSAVYMAAEKAADVLLDRASMCPPPGIAPRADRAERNRRPPPA